MNQTARHNRVAVIFFSVTIVLFLAFFLYMGTFEQVSIYHADQTHDYQILTDLELELVTDSTAPAGVRKIYRGTLAPEPAAESCLCFNISHHDVQIYFDDVLMYSLTGAETNRIGHNVSSNWCTTHVGEIHTGKSVTVVLTPLFEAALSKYPTFLLGSHYAIAMDILTGELPLLILSVLCILLGLFVFAVFLYFHRVVDAETNGLGYLGLFSAAMGLWKLADLRCMPLLLPQDSMALGYICVGALFLTGLCLMLYFSTLFVKERQKGLLLLSCGGCVICLAVLALQVLGITEIRQNLVYSHVLLIAAMASIPLAAVYNRIVHKNFGLRRSWKLLLMLLAGISVDLFLYYRNNGNGLMSFSIMSFIVYTLIISLTSIQDATRKAYIDSRTGLLNRARWNELMDDDISLPEPYGILMIDLNGLKWVNDTLGHEAGDQMIFQLSNILQNTLPRSSVICRWGGDEFAALLTGIKREQMEQYIEKLFAAAESYNADNPELPVHFALGAVLSTEHPGVSRAELFRLADGEMYHNKRLWYAQKHTTK